MKKTRISKETYCQSNSRDNHLTSGGNMHIHEIQLLLIISTLIILAGIMEINDLIELTGLIVEM